MVYDYEVNMKLTVLRGGEFSRARDPTPYTLHPAPYSVHREPSTVNPQPSTLVHQPRHGSWLYNVGCPSRFPPPPPSTLNTTPGCARRASHTPRQAAALCHDLFRRTRRPSFEGNPLSKIFFTPRDLLGPWFITGSDPRCARLPVWAWGSGAGTVFLRGESAG